MITNEEYYSINWYPYKDKWRQKLGWASKETIEIDLDTGDTIIEPLFYVINDVLYVTPHNRTIKINNFDTLNKLVKLYTEILNIENNMEQQKLQKINIHESIQLEQILASWNIY